MVKSQNEFYVFAVKLDLQRIHQIIIINVAGIHHNTLADALMAEISAFVQENTRGDLG